MRPVTTVPRPEIENTSSTGIRNGLSIARSGTGMYASIASTSFITEGTPELDSCRLPAPSAPSP